LIQRLAAAIELPLNIMLLPNLSPAARLQELGVRRVSSGGGAFASAYTHLAKSVAAYLVDGAPGAFSGGPEMGNLNKRFG
jgi:2-methylisocitrate lyase-like PEP mutase family enzyme